MTARVLGRPYAVARSLLAAQLLVTLLANSSDGMEPIGRDCSYVGQALLTCWHSDSASAVPVVVATVVLVLVAIGWRPRWTAIPHAWVSFAFVQAHPLALTGGDVLASNLCLLLLPMALIDPRRWQWGPSPELERDAAATAALFRRLCAVQMGAVYLLSVVAKLRIDSWRSGTAMSRILPDLGYGAAPWARWSEPLLGNGVVDRLTTWSVLLVEVLLPLGVFLGRRARRTVLASGMLMHLGIAVVFGLTTFTVVMVAGLLMLYYRDLCGLACDDRRVDEADLLTGDRDARRGAGAAAGEGDRG